jgi:hypothetical protein
MQQTVAKKLRIAVSSVEIMFSEGITLPIIATGVKGKDPIFGQE